MFYLSAFCSFNIRNRERGGGSEGGRCIEGKGKGGGEGDEEEGRRVEDVLKVKVGGVGGDEERELKGIKEIKLACPQLKPI